MLKQSLTQKMLQKLSPQQIQLMKLLQVPTANLEQRIKEELENNPALEDWNSPEVSLEAERDRYTEDRSPDFAGEQGVEKTDSIDYLRNYMQSDAAGFHTRGERFAVEGEDKNLPLPVEETFHDFLEQQFGMLVFDNEQEEAIARQIIGSIDQDGYLRRDNSSIIDDLMFSQNIFVTERQVEKVLRQVQRFDPPGVGARDLRECLLIQLESLLAQEDGEGLENRDAVDLALRIVRDAFEEFSQKHFAKLQRQFDITEDDLKAAIEVIVRLNPKPASGFAPGASQITQYIIPDFIVANRDGELELTLNARNAPDLRVSEQYRRLLQSLRIDAKGRRQNAENREAQNFIKQKIVAARWFIDALRQRQETLYRTMHAILQYQREYFLSGDERKLRPMILKDIADIAGLDISTVSRVVNSKYVQTEFGVRRLKDFFSESLQTADGEEVSTIEVKKILADILAAEDKRDPLSDEKLKELLQEKGYHIARRTVAKYREQFNVPIARLRKEL